MCVIVIKPRGHKAPTKEQIKNMWTTNPDGAGIAWNDGTTVHVIKGLMTLEDFTRAARSIRGAEKWDIMYHFRITTHGATAPEQCHPFPVTGDEKRLQRLKYRAPVAVAHNGMISSVKAHKVLSDTQVFIRDRLSKLHTLAPDWYATTTGRELVRELINSKMGVLTATDYYTIGDFKRDGALIVSNLNYQWPTNWADWDKWDAWRGVADYTPRAIKAPRAWDRDDDDGDGVDDYTPGAWGRDGDTDDVDIWPLSPTDYIVTDDGDYLTGGGYLIDYYGHIWTDETIPRRINGTAFTKEGLLI